MDLSKLTELDAAKNDTTHEFELLHPATGAGLGVFLTAISPQSDGPKKISSRYANKVLADEAKGKLKLTVEEVEKKEIELQSACIVGWRGVEEDGKKVEFSTDALRENILGNGIFREQIQEALNDLGNFISA